jgi:ABC-type glycerol-3-phosphate transport system substrate-binding protein
MRRTAIRARRGLLPFAVGMMMAVGLGLAGCGGGDAGGADKPVPDPAPGGTAPPAKAAPAGAVRLVFWHTRRGDQEQALKAICTEFAQANPGVEVLPEYQGSYGDLNKKVRASIQGKQLPALTVGYESQVAEYAANDVVRPLDDFVKDPEIGFKEDELKQIPELYLSSNRFAKYNNQLLSFPFTKSNLVMYYNKTLLASAGVKEPPKTWPEFEKAAGAVTAKLGAPAFGFTADPSTLDGLIFSFGGDVLGPDGQTTLFDQPPSVSMFQMLERMTRARTLVEGKGDQVASLFHTQKIAFVIDTSSGRSAAEKVIGSQFDWDVTVPPHADGVKPVTVMYGPNVCIFKASPEQERAAWKFVKYFVSPAVTGRWARETGYLPVTKAALDLPEMKEFYQKNPRALHVWETLAAAKGEPTVVGWQEVRDTLSEAARAVVGGGTTPQAAAAELKQKADAALAESR